MATAHRTMNELPTLRCTVALRDRRPVLATRAFIGATALGPEQITALPIPDGQNAKATERQELRQNLMAGIKAQHSHPVAEQLRMLEHETDAGVPLWLQIGQDSAEAALLPWEELIHDITGRGTLRTPNFLRNPFTSGETFKLAICASVPRAKGEWNLPAELMHLTEVFSRALNFGYSEVEVSLFLPESLPHFALQEVTRTDNPDLRISIAPSDQNPAPSQPRDAQISDTSTIKNPWLLWMQNHYANTGVDAVHFICPGYSSRDQGALALAQSPTDNTDANWARFVGQNELTRFYSEVGASIMGFTAVGAAPWAEAIHRLAYQLSWSRPGAIYVTETGSQNAGLEALLRGICTDFGLETAHPTTSTAYAYPQMLIQPTGMFERVSEPEEHFYAPHPENDMKVRFDSASHDRSTHEDNWRTVAAPFDPFKLHFATEKTAADQSQNALIQRHIATERARVSSIKIRTSIEEAKDNGTSAALDFLEELMQQ